MASYQCATIDEIQNSSDKYINRIIFCRKDNGHPQNYECRFNETGSRRNNII